MSKHDAKSHARRIHREAILIDGHNDHIMLKCEQGKPIDLMKVNRKYHSDAPRLLKGGMTASLFMVDGHDLARSMMIVERALREIARHPKHLMQVTRTADIRRAKRTGRLGIMLTWESGMALCNNIDILRLAYRLGIRSITLTHFEGGCQFALQGTPSYFGYCTPEDRASFRRTMKGLTSFGRQVVKEMNRLGMLVDLAHINDAAFYDVIEITEKPAVSTHGGVFACAPHARCLTDDQIRAIARTDGLLGIAFYHKFISRKRATVDKIVDQMAYVADLVGIKHVGIGSDFDGLGEGVWPVIRTADRLPTLTEAMVRRGFSDAEIKKVLGGNFLRVLKATIG
ncbi:MAG: membrane dipeptidase [Planctomycetes bacterium]|nr:membrane dipeptidase [Planctomycetota bacterium]